MCIPANPSHHIIYHNPSFCIWKTCPRNPQYHTTFFLVSPISADLSCLLSPSHTLAANNHRNKHNAGTHRFAILSQPKVVTVAVAPHPPQMTSDSNWRKGCFLYSDLFPIRFVCIQRCIYKQFSLFFR
ncbi:hypothetical protein HanIR_Chr05g0237601 [Helianthus annuus]|nr:hypothetical protein HanIR_Chr05g0237601 [Helianthus annuus]